MTMAASSLPWLATADATAVTTARRAGGLPRALAALVVATVLSLAAGGGLGRRAPDAPQAQASAAAAGGAGGAPPAPVVTAAARA